MSGESFIADNQINVEEETVQNIMLEKLQCALSKLSAEELLLIDSYCIHRQNQSMKPHQYLVFHKMR